MHIMAVLEVDVLMAVVVMMVLVAVDAQVVFKSITSLVISFLLSLLFFSRRSLNANPTTI